MVVVPADIAKVVLQHAAPGVAIAALGSTPEESLGSNTSETTTGKAKTTWETGKTT